MIFVIGDIHRDVDIGKLEPKNFPEGQKLTKEDYVIICGDTALTWDRGISTKYWQNWLDEQPWTTLWCDGNHENFSELETYPIEEWNGGKVHKINNSIYHLMRGEIFELDGEKFFVMGGADSIDKDWRIPGISWWSEEMPSYQEMEYAMSNLDKHDWCVDYVITHCAPANVQYSLNPQYTQDGLTKFLFEIDKKLDFKHWYFGHYHEDKEVDDKHTCLYQKVKRIK